tara:strand:+ start:205 stop:912 length:708 start_codon:yes stop_codon:yes gene_type:complete
MLDVELLKTLNYRNISDFIKLKSKNIPQSSLVLDIGSGTKPFEHLFKNHNYHSHDFDGYKNYKNSSQQKYTYNCDILDIPEEIKYDILICTEVVEHLPDIKSTFKKLKKLLKPSGDLLLTFPFASMYHQEPYFFTSGYSTYLIENLCKEFEMDVIEYQQSGTYITSVQLDFLRINYFFRKNHNFILKLLNKMILFFVLNYLKLIENKDINLDENNKKLNNLKPIGYLYHLKNSNN